MSLYTGCFVYKAVGLEKLGVSYNFFSVELGIVGNYKVERMRKFSVYNARMEVFVEVQWGLVELQPP